VAFFDLAQARSGGRGNAPAERRAPNSPMRDASRSAKPSAGPRVAAAATGTHGNFRPY
jgi:hypothetical protein